MNFMTRMELKEFSDTELVALLGLILRELGQAKEGSLEWYAAMTSLDNIYCEQAKRRVVVRPQPRGPCL